MPEEGNFKDQYNDLLTIYLSDLVATFPDVAKRNLYGTTLSSKLYKVFEALFKYSLNFIKWCLNIDQVKEETIAKKNWLYILGTNNYNTVEFLQNDINDAVFITPYDYKNPKATIHKVVFPLRIFHLFKNLTSFFPLINDKSRPANKRAWDTVFKSLGTVESAKWLLEKYKPSNIIFANDHTLEPRALLLAAKQLGIPTFYIQHACVRDDFPPLKFDHNLLEGPCAKDIYETIGPISGAIKLIGIPRMDQYIKSKNTADRVRRIGICSNLLDDIEEIEKIIQNICSIFPEVAVSYRPHPSDKRTLNIPADQISYSNSNKEIASDFLQRQDLIIAADTSIHYEAVMLNVYSVYYRFGDESRKGDLYLFCKNGISVPAVDVNEVIKIVTPLTKSKADVYTKAMYYNAALGNEMEGNSAKTAGEYIKNIINKRNSQKITIS